MSSNGWRNVRIEDSIVEIIDGDRGVNYPKQDEFFDSGYCLFLNAGNVTADDFNFEKAQFITEEKDNLLRKGKLTRNDIVLTTRGTVGNVAHFDDSIKYDNIRINSGMVIFRIDESRREIFTKYFYYFLKSPIFKERVLSHSSGSAQPQLPIKDLKQIEISLPSFETQHRIADILSALDEKIKLNRQTNVTLEAITQAIFKEWFVDFNFPGATSEMVESELGMIPRGWRVGSFRDILNNELGGDWGEDNSFEGSVPAISLRGTDLEKLKSFGYAPEAPLRWVKGSSLEKRKITSKDILIAGSGLGPIGRSIYYASILQDIYPYPIIYSNFCKKLRAESPAYAIYAERLLELIYINGEMRQFFTGTSIPNLDIQSLLAYKIIIPQAHILEEYYKRIGKSKFDFLFNPENIYLTQIRDVLLPKLMSGEIEV